MQGRSSRREFAVVPTKHDGESKRDEELDSSLIQREVFRLALEREARAGLTLREALALLDAWPEGEL